jgi:hypothetical protein
VPAYTLNRDAVRHAKRLIHADPGSKEVGASWVVRLEADDAQEASTGVDVSRTAMAALEHGTVANETRMALRTQGRNAVEALARRRDEPAVRILSSTDGCRAER